MIIFCDPPQPRMNRKSFPAKILACARRTGEPQNNSPDTHLGGAANFPLSTHCHRITDDRQSAVGAEHTYSWGEPLERLSTFRFCCSNCAITICFISRKNPIKSVSSPLGPSKSVDSAVAAAAAAPTRFSVFPSISFIADFHVMCVELAARSNVHAAFFLTAQKKRYGNGPPALLCVMTFKWAFHTIRENQQLAN